MCLSSKPYDVFISYVVEDREIVELLYEELTAQRVKVWYANRELYPGSEIRSEINKGLDNSRFGVALITPSYTGHWALGELFYLMRNKDTLIPVLHEISRDEVARSHPEIVTLFCLNTSCGVENTAIQIADYIKKRSSLRACFSKIISRIKKNALLLFSFLGLALLSTFLVLRGYADGQPDDSLVKEQIEKRISNIESSVQQEIRKDIARNNALASTLDEIIRAETALVGGTTKYRNYVDFYDGMAHIRTQTGLKNAGIFHQDASLAAPYGLTEYTTYWFKTDTNRSVGIGYSFVCLLPLVYDIKATRAGADLYEVDVNYTNCLRYAVAQVSIDTIKKMRISDHHFFGIKPFETFVFEKQGDTWLLALIR
ncbi:MAG: toll/interleukin-1 receptor domain-containing protein [Bacteroidia bacterium]